MVRELAIEIFQEAGYTVLDAPNGAAALAICDRHEGCIDLLVTDLVMPGMNGIELARKVRDSRPGIPVLFMSGYAEDAKERLGDLDERRAFLQKPITPTNLSRKVREIFSERAAQDRGVTLSRTSRVPALEMVPGLRLNQQVFLARKSHHQRDPRPDLQLPHPGSGTSSDGRPFPPGR